MSAKAAAAGADTKQDVQAGKAAAGTSKAKAAATLPPPLPLGGASHDDDDSQVDQNAEAPLLLQSALMDDEDGDAEDAGDFAAVVGTMLDRLGCSRTALLHSSKSLSTGQHCFTRAHEQQPCALD